MTEDSFNPFASEEMTAPFNAQWQARRRVGDALKQITELLLTSDPPVDELQSIAEGLEASAEALRESPRIYGRAAYLELGGHGSYGHISHEINPLSGLSNPIAPPVNTWFDGDRAYGKVTLNWSYEGPPGTVHGGIVAAVFDHFLGMAQTLGGQPGMTGNLKVHYHRRTPLNQELSLEAWIKRLDGRKTIVCGEMYAQGEMTASCEGLFVQPKDGIRMLKPL